LKKRFLHKKNDNDPKKQDVADVYSRAAFGRNQKAVSALNMGENDMGKIIGGKIIGGKIIGGKMMGGKMMGRQNDGEAK